MKYSRKENNMCEKRLSRVEWIYTIVMPHPWFGDGPPCMTARQAKVLEIFTRIGLGQVELHWILSLLKIDYYHLIGQ